MSSLSPWEMGRERETRMRVGRGWEWYHKNRETNSFTMSPKNHQTNLPDFFQSMLSKQNFWH